MQPEDRLDALLTSHGLNERLRADPPATEGLNGHTAGDDLQPLLDAATRLTKLASAMPAADFSDSLEARIFAHAAQLEAQLGAEPTLDSAPTLPPEQDALDMAALVQHDTPTIPGVIWGAQHDDATELDLAPHPIRRNARPHQQTRWMRLLGPALAATLLLALGAVSFTAALAAGPDSPLYGLHRWEQGVQISMAGSAADRARLHLSYAQDALTTLDTTVAQHQTGSVYDESLATFRDEMTAATTNLDAVPAGAEHDALAAQLTETQARGRVDLRAALASLSWPQRVTTTEALAAIGDNVLHVTQTQMVYSGHGQHLWTITVTGSGFQQGATLLVNGQPAGSVISVTPTTLVAQMSGDDSAPLPGSVGVANPDHTVAVTGAITSHEQGNAGTPTPGGDDHGGDNHGGSGGDDNGGSGGGDNSGRGSSGGSGGSGSSGGSGN